MKNILLFGDSIRRGYDEAVKSSLAGIANVYFPEDNSRFAAYAFRYLREYKRLLDGAPCHLIHWNAGLWDCLRLFEDEPQTPIEIYTYYIDRICQRLQKLFPEASVIFATSTSVQTEKMDKDLIRYNREIEAYNRAAIAVVEKYGFGVNDLYATSLTLPEEAHSDPVHYYTPIGTEVFANQVLAVITKALGIDEPIIYKEELYTDEPVGM